ncbi:MAG TPA: hypothetical protein VNT51_04275 [Miltoncostaeaceae bacterium]|nr:hypothetical protein [Miltoncostaeaceae bacterium]
MAADGGDGDRATVAGALRLGAGWQDSERDDVLARLSQLDNRLKSFRADEVDMELSVKERGGPQQKVTLECWLAGLPRVVGTAEEPDLMRGLTRARDEVITQITQVLGRREPKANRHLRESVRGADAG